MDFVHCVCLHTSVSVLRAVTLLGLAHPLMPFDKPVNDETTKVLMPWHDACLYCGIWLNVPMPVPHQHTQKQRIVQMMTMEVWPLTDTFIENLTFFQGSFFLPT